VTKREAFKYNFKYEAT
jgi:hypothetical protein